VKFKVFATAKPSPAPTAQLADRQRGTSKPGDSHTSDDLTKPPKASQKNDLKHSLDVASKVAYHMNMSSHIWAQWQTE